MLPGPLKTLSKELPKVVSGAVRISNYSTRISPTPEDGVVYDKKRVENLSKMDLGDAAKYHFMERMEVIHRQQLVMGLLASNLVIPPNAMAKIAGARYQIVHGSVIEDTQAAHVPITFNVNGQSLETYLHDPLAKEAIKVMLTHTNIVPTAINKMDSLVERKFLKLNLEYYLNKMIYEFSGVRATKELTLGLEMALRSNYQDLSKLGRDDIEKELKLLKYAASDAETRKKKTVLEAYHEALHPKNIPESTSEKYIEMISPVFGIYPVKGTERI